MLEVLEEYFGTPYPYKKLDLIAVPENFGGAMENVGAITYNEWLMLMDEESSLDQRRAYTVVHAHEMAICGSATWSHRSGGTISG